MWCGKAWTFHDDEEGKYLLLCNDCFGKWQRATMVSAIVSGEFVPGELSDENEDEDD